MRVRVAGQGRQGEKLQDPQELGLEPRRRDAVVLVVLRAFALHEVVQALRHGRDDLPPLVYGESALLQDGQHEATGRGQQPDVPVPEQLHQPLAPEVRLQGVRVSAVEAEEADAGLALDVRGQLHRVRKQHLRDVIEEVVRKLRTPDVGDSVQCQRRDVLVPRTHVQLHTVHHQPEDLRIVPEQHGHGEVARGLLAELDAGAELHGLYVAKVHIVA
mmetsp:Transcript_35625/g.111114  ORF Transcript_35625/g.111114 Transcript_35625/m.111114 type:complete len:216 (-) Transcript_35625:309-956(-)